MEQQFDFFEEKPLSQVTIGELQAMVKTMQEKRKQYDEQKRIASLINDEVEEIEAKIMAVLEEQNMTKFSVDGIGTVYTSEKFQVSFPKEADKADELRAWCKENNLEGMLTINSQSLNSLYKQKVEEAKLNGDLDFTNVIAGVDEPKVRKTIGFRKG